MQSAIYDDSSVDAAAAILERQRAVRTSSLAFTDNLDVINRMFHSVLDREDGSWVAGQDDPSAPLPTFGAARFRTRETDLSRGRTGLWSRI